MAFTDYSNITDNVKNKIVRRFDDALRMGATTGQAIAIAAHDAYELTDRQWNGKMGSNAFASACAVLVMAEKLKRG